MLLTLGKKRMEQTMSFEEFGADLAEGQVAADTRENADPAYLLLLEEVRIGCTLAMLQSLDREHRLAYILGEILDLGHREAAEALDISGRLSKTAVASLCSHY